jgi:hypothetical protein
MESNRQALLLSGVVALALPDPAKPERPLYRPTLATRDRLTVRLTPILFVNQAILEQNNNALRIGIGDSIMKYIKFRIYSCIVQDNRLISISFFSKPPPAGLMTSKS